ncbi:Glutathione S-transferase domain protein [Sphingomonas antarctica]|uniref:glutathione S-transferase family protein n=1 Tax=Sphingomonas antarctica TaxID=2040274 RepID=UPI0039E9DE95
MILYDSARAPNPRRVRWVMAEKNITDVEIVETDIFKGEHRTPDYVRRAGVPNVPALTIDDDTTITESLAICHYLESVYPEPNVFGRDAREVAVIEMWTRRAEMMVATPLMLTVRHSHPALAAIETKSAEFAAVQRQGAERALSFFNQRLADSEFIAGHRVTMADIVAFCSLDFARMIKFRPDEAHTDLARWADMMRARPAAQAGVG